MVLQQSTFCCFPQISNAITKKTAHIVQHAQNAPFILRAQIKVFTAEVVLEASPDPLVSVLNSVFFRTHLLLYIIMTIIANCKMLFLYFCMCAQFHIQKFAKTAIYYKQNFY